MNQEEHATTGSHPVTVDDISGYGENRQQSSSMGNRLSSGYTDSSSKQANYNQQTSAASGAHPTTVDDISQPGGDAGFLNQNDLKSPESSTRSEYGSTDERSHTSQSQRPVADRDAFIQSTDTKNHWQFNMTPAERAKQLAAEMKGGERRRSSVEKLLRIGGKKDIKLE